MEARYKLRAYDNEFSTNFEQQATYWVKDWCDEGKNRFNITGSNFSEKVNKWHTKMTKLESRGKGTRMTDLIFPAKDVRYYRSFSFEKMTEIAFAFFERHSLIQTVPKNIHFKNCDGKHCCAHHPMGWAAGPAKTGKGASRRSTKRTILEVIQAKYPFHGNFKKGYPTKNKEHFLCGLFPDDHNNIYGNIYVAGTKQQMRNHILLHSPHKKHRSFNTTLGLSHICMK